MNDNNISTLKKQKNMLNTFDKNNDTNENNNIQPHKFGTTSPPKLGLPVPTNWDYQSPQIGTPCPLKLGLKAIYEIEHAPPDATGVGAIDAKPSRMSNSFCMCLMKSSLLNEHLPPA